MHQTLSLLALLIFGASVTAFLPKSAGPRSERSARAELESRAVEAEPLSLLAAVKRGDGEVMKLLLRSSVGPDAKDKEGRTPLMLALQNKRPHLAEELIAAGADLKAKDGKGEAVLGYAVQAGEPTIVGALLDRGINPNTKSADGGRVVAEAVKTGRLASAKMMLEAGASKWAMDSAGSSLIFHATVGGADWMVEQLLASGVSSDARDAAGDSLVHAVARGGKSEFVRTFWKSGVNLNALNAKGETPLHVALLVGRYDVIPKLLEHGASPGSIHKSGWKPLHLALQRGDTKAVSVLLEHGANPNAAGSQGRTAMDLVLALDAPAEQLVALLKAGADPNAKGPDGRTPFDAALAKRDFATAQILLEHGAGPGTSLTNAVVENDAETISFLLRNKVDPSDSAGDSPLVAAVRNGAPELVAQLLEAGASPEASGREGQSALHLAVAMDRADLAELLLGAGADPSVPFAEPYTPAFLSKLREIGYAKWQFTRDRRIYPIMVAADSGNLPLARVLLKHGARKNVWTSRMKYYPVGFAARRDDVKMMQLLLDRDPAHEQQWIKVDLSAQRAWVYNKAGETILSTRIASGKQGFRTETGEFVITNKTRHHVSTIYDGAEMPYFQRLSCGDFGFHEGHCPGYAASHGCIRVPRGNASKLWKITKTGDRVVIVP